MSQIEFLILIPGIVIALALAEMVVYVGKAVRNKVLVYWELALLIFVSLDILMTNWFNFYNRVQYIDQSYFIFVLINLVPIIYFVYVSILVPDPFGSSEVTNGKNHFLSNRKMIYLILTIYIVANYFTIDYFADDGKQLLRLAIVPLVGVNIFFDSKYLRTGVLVLAEVAKYFMLWAESQPGP